MNNILIYINPYTKYLNQYSTYIFIGIILLMIIIFAINKRFRLLVQKLIYKAEIGELVKSSLYTVVESANHSNWDEKMVLVIAELLVQIPVIRFLPKSFIVKFLNKRVQNIFNSVRKLLHAQKEKVERERLETLLNVLISHLEKEKGDK